MHGGEPAAIILNSPLGKPSKKKNYESVDAVQRGGGVSEKHQFFFSKKFGQSPRGGGQKWLSIVVFVKKVCIWHKKGHD